MTQHCHDASCHTHVADAADHSSALASLPLALPIILVAVLLILAEWRKGRETAKRDAQTMRALRPWYEERRRTQDSWDRFNRR